MKATIISKVDVDSVITIKYINFLNRDVFQSVEIIKYGIRITVFVCKTTFWWMATVLSAIEMKSSMHLLWNVCLIADIMGSGLLHQDTVSVWMDIIEFWVDVVNVPLLKSTIHSTNAVWVKSWIVTDTRDSTMYQDDVPVHKTTI